MSLATLGPSAYWYLARGTGAVSLVLLTAAVVLGILGPLRVSGSRWPRFAIDTLHRDISLLVVVLLLLHIVTSILDGFAPISVTAAVIPFISPYRPLWLGLGALAFDLIIALVITSLVRRSLGYGRWRAVHWLAYASFPIGVLHGLGTGSDTKLWWMLMLTAACVAAVVVATCARIARSIDAPQGLRPAALMLSLATPLALAGFALLGPLASGWARRAGTPSSLLGHVTRGRPVRTTASATTGSGTTGPGAFTASVSGSVTQEQVSGGAIVDLNMHLTGGTSGRLRVRLAGQPSGGGGLSMTGSQVDLLTRGSVLAGQITSLQGSDFAAQVRGRSGAITLHAQLNIDSGNDSVTGSVHAIPDGGGQ